MRLLRFIVFGLLLSFSLPILATAGTVTPEKISLQLKWLHSFQFAGYYAAKAKGFYAEENLEVELRERKVGTNNIHQIINGDSEYGVADTSLLVERLNGVPIVVLASIFQHSPLVYVSLQSSGIVSPYEMQGKRIMDDDYDNAVLRAMLYESSLTSTDFVHLPNSANLNDLIQGKTDVVAAYSTDEIDHYKQRGVAINVINPRNYGVDFVGDNLFTTQKEITTHPERVEKFIRASLKGWDYAVNHPDEIVNLIFTQYNTQSLTLNHLQFEARETSKMITPQSISIGRSDSSRFERIAEIYKALGLVQSTDNLNGFIYGEKNTWLSLKAKADLNWKRLVSYAIPLIILLALISYWNFRLRREIAQRQKLEIALQHSIHLFKSVLDNVPMVRIFWKDLNGYYLGGNTDFTRDAGLNAIADIIGKTDYDLTWQEYADSYRADDLRVIAKNEPKLQYEKTLVLSGGREILSRTSKVPLRDENKNIIGILGIYEDITALKAHSQQLEYIAHHDMLTGLPNRLLLADRMQLALAHTRREHCLMVVGYIDLDSFKSVNDKIGRKAGDYLLIDAAKRIKNVLREEDTVARLGGDEFVFILLGLTSQEECEATLHRILNILNLPFQLDEHLVSISASIGVTIFPNDHADADTLLRHADQAMYESKQQRKNSFKIYDTAGAQAFEVNQSALNRIKEALNQNEFELFFQPKVNMRKGMVLGAEALIRWRHPERGLLMPGEFLALIEHHELAILLDNWVMNAALTQIAHWHERGLMWTVSVNLSVRSLQADDFIENIAQLLEKYPSVKPELLELEILETEALDDLAKTSKIMAACQRFGVKFSLDDFGTGYSSLSYLKHLPANTLKIDQSFVRDMLVDSDDLAIVEGVIGLAQSFKRYVIAEGVESIEQGVALLKLNCHYAQGYVIAKPMPAKIFEAWAENWQAPKEWKN